MDRKTKSKTNRLIGECTALATVEIDARKGECLRNAAEALHVLSCAMTFPALREANDARAMEWNPDGPPLSAEFAIIELAGEVGELCNAMKKRLRFDRGLKGGVNDPQNLADELADVVICADLLARKLGLDLGQAVAHKFNATSVKHGFVTRIGGGC